MNIHALINSIIMEEEFKAKYTKRQRSIFCKNMYKKIESFILENEALCIKAHTHLLIQSHEKEKKELLHKIDTYHKIMLKRHTRYICLDILCGLVACLWLIYSYGRVMFVILKSSVKTGQ